MYLSTERCIIRNMSLEDAEKLHDVLSDPDVMMYIEPAFDMEKTIHFVSTAGQGETPMVYTLVLKENSNVIGHVIFHPYDENSFEIGWVISKAYWGIGLADEITKALIQCAKGITEYCVIECDERQAASAHIALKNSFKYEGNQDGLSIYRLKLQK